ncbi:MerR family transcriptional regulator [Rhodococcus cerastii]|uniref:MerR family transcriptional regulator n=1 Tax=Rhodococcus cerastii TaxID=908616 RepID=A0ABU4CV17_9NOCA|nr:MULTISPECIES: MerR family transcriptional regulator [Rhodococcus]MDV6300949.1 MerR family transcriptional regulator [Rhodococcus cerastii]MDV8075294.1 MerR family transcriptional regulator [Rhodococcus sp. IEGM 1370]
MNSSDSSTWGIGDVARRTGVTERTLRYYEELGLLAPVRDGGGRRRYDGRDLDRLYRIRLLRELGTQLGDVDPDAADLLHLSRQHLADLDRQMAELARVRERVRAVEDRLLHGALLGDDALLDLLSGLSTEEPAVTRRTTLLVYRDIAAAHSYLVDVFGLAPGPIEYDGDRAVHGEVHAGDGVVWLHREAPEFRMVSPLTTGSVTASLAILVDDVDAHHARVAATGASIDYPPTDMPYGVREYSVRDPEGHLWSFQSPIEEQTSS